MINESELTERSDSPSRGPTGPPADATATPTRSVLSLGLRGMRRERRWSQEELAQRSGLHAETIGRLERGGRRNLPHDGTLRALAWAFDCTSLAAFWEQLHQSAAAIRASNHAPIVLHVDERIARVVRMFLDVPERQRKLIEATLLQYHATLDAPTRGEDRSMR